MIIIRNAIHYFLIQQFIHFIHFINLIHILSIYTFSQCIHFIQFDFIRFLHLIKWFCFRRLYHMHGWLEVLNKGNKNIWFKFAILVKGEDCDQHKLIIELNTINSSDNCSLCSIRLNLEPISFKMNKKIQKIKINSEPKHFLSGWLTHTFLNYQKIV